MDPVRGGWVIFCKGNVIWEKTLLMTHGPMQWKWVVLERVHILSQLVFVTDSPKLQAEIIIK